MISDQLVNWKAAQPVRDLAGYTQACAFIKTADETIGNENMFQHTLHPEVFAAFKPGKLTHFNLAFYHLLSLESRQYRTLRMIMKESDMPTYSNLGNGEPAPAEMIVELKNAYQQAARCFSWQPKDMLIMDNIIYAHGSDSFSGARRILVTMAEPIARSYKARLDRPTIVKAFKG